MENFFLVKVSKAFSLCKMSSVLNKNKGEKGLVENILSLVSSSYSHKKVIAIHSFSNEVEVILQGTHFTQKQIVVFICITGWRFFLVLHSCLKPQWAWYYL